MTQASANLTTFLLRHGCPIADILRMRSGARSATPRPPARLRFRLNNRKVSLNYRPGTTDLFVIREIFCQNCYALPPGFAPRTVLDFGANIGLASLFIALQADPARPALIHAFEPVPANFQLLQANIAANPFANITPHPFGLAATDRDLDISPLQDNHPGSFSIHAEGQQGASQTIRLRSVTQTLQDLGIESADVLKIDVEGAESEILPALAPHLHRFEIILGELHGDKADIPALLSLLSATHHIDIEKSFGPPYWNFRASLRPWSDYAAAA